MAMVAGLLLCGAFDGNAAADILPPEDDSVAYILETIVVHGRRADHATMISRYTASELTRRNAITVADVLRADAALTVTTGGKAETQTRIRGFPARDVLVLVDGRPINPGYYGKVDLSMLPLENIAQIKVIKGPASVAYGPNAMGGVVNIVTANGSGPDRTVISGDVGDYGFRRLGLNWSRGLEHFDFQLNGYEHHADGFALSADFAPTAVEDGGRREGSYYHRRGATGKATCLVSDKTRYALSLGYHWAERDIPPVTSLFETAYFQHFPDWHRGQAALSGAWELSADCAVKAVLFADTYYDRLVRYNSSGMSEDNIEFDSRLENWSLGGSVDGKLQVGRVHHLHAGGHLKRDLMNKKPDLGESWFSRCNYTFGAFVQDTYDGGNRIRVTAGAAVNAMNREQSGERTAHVSPTVTVNVTAPFHLDIHAGYSRAIRFPTLHQLYSTSSGNPDLEPEQAAKVEIGVSRRFVFGAGKRAVALEGAWFYHDMKNLIYRESRSYRYHNICEARSQGVEAHMVVHLSDLLCGEVNYTYIQQVDTSDILMEEVPANRFGVRGTLDTRFGAGISYELNHVGERQTYLASVILPNYLVHNINMRQELGHGLTIRIRIDNVTDVDYAEELGYPSPGRQVTGGITLTI